MLEVSVTNERQRRTFTHAAGKLEFGRAATDDESRFVVEDRYVSRDQLRVEELPDGRVRLTNLGRAVKLGDGTLLEERASCDVALPVQITIGYSTIELRAAGEAADAPAHLQTIAPPVRTLPPAARDASLASMGDSTPPELLASWFETLLSVQRAAAGSAEFYEETARAVVEMIGLDRGMVLLDRGGQWETASSHGARTAQARDYSHTVLRRVVQQKRTFYRSPQAIQGAASLQMLEAVVAAPVFDPQDEVVGVVYGSRDSRGGEARGVSRLEAQLVQLLAGAVSAGLARMEREAEAARSRVQLEEFVSPQVARELERNPKLLEGQEREISVMFADVRGFSRISERLDVRTTYQLAGDVMDRLTNCVARHDGTIIDYYGDGFAAMWNAPTDQADHAGRACRAALEMTAAAESLSEQWGDKVGGPVKIGVGIHAGVAQVGNAGSQRRLKYGPRGHTVNLASRVEGATKHFGLSLLISEAVRERISDEFAVRKLCRVRVKGIDGDVRLFELVGACADETRLQLCERFEAALALYEDRKWSEAQATLAPLLVSEPPDEPCRILDDLLR